MRRLRPLVLFAALVLAPGMVSAQSEPDPRALQPAIDQLYAEQTAPGVSAAVIGPHDDDAVRAWAGKMARDAGPVGPHTRYLAGSLGKTVTGLIAAQLVHEGRLDLDTPITAWLADRPWIEELEHGDAITMRHLLTHTAGVPDYLEDWRFHLALRLRREHSFTPDELIGFVASHTPTGEPGAAFSYSDTHFIIAGLVLEAVTGSAYGELVRDRVIVPLGLSETEVLAGRHYENLATGYDRALFGGKTATLRGDALIRDFSYEGAAGGLVTGPADLARLFLALGSEAFAPYRAIMIDEAWTLDAERGTGYGLGVYVTRNEDGTYRLFHGGDFAGYRSAALYDSRSALALAVQANAKSFEAPDAVFTLMDTLTGHPGP
jgi:D-alanyl-D-alanine carboxypeptidase